MDKYKMYKLQMEHLQAVKKNINKRRRKLDVYKRPYDAELLRTLTVELHRTQFAINSVQEKMKKVLDKN